MGNKINKINKTANEKEKSKILNRKILDMLELKQADAYDGFKEKMGKKVKNILQSKICGLLNDKQSMLSLGHTIVGRIFDTNENENNFKDGLNLNFNQSYFLYDTIRDKNENKNSQKENFYAKKLKMIDNVFSDTGNNSRDINVNTSIRYNRFEELLQRSLSRSSSIKHRNFDTKSSFKIEGYPHLQKELNTSYVSDTNETPKMTETIYFEDMNPNLHTNDEEIERNFNHKISNIESANIIHNSNESINSDEENIVTQNKSIYKKRIYTRPPVVNIKIKMKDIIKQDVAETKYNINKFEQRVRERNLSKTRSKSKNKLNKMNDLSYEIMKNNFTRNKLDSSFVDMVDILSQTSRLKKPIQANEESKVSIGKNSKTKNSFVRILPKIK